MKLLKFWPDRGGYNDTVVSLSIFLTMASSFACDAWYGAPWWALLVCLLLGPIVGFVLGFALVIFLCTYFGRR